MTGQLILPPDYLDIEGPLVFLAGPIQGAPRWQDSAIRIIRLEDEGLHIANPRRGAFLDSDFVYNEQVDWETHYLRRAAEDGAILFWLAKEAEHSCDRAYAQTAGFELGEWQNERKRSKAMVAVGIEPGFTNERYIRRRLSQGHPGLPVYPTLEETCRKVIQMAYTRTTPSSQP